MLRHLEGLGIRVQAVEQPIERIAWVPEQLLLLWLDVVSLATKARDSEMIVLSSPES